MSKKLLGLSFLICVLANGSSFADVADEKTKIIERKEIEKERDEIIRNNKFSDYLDSSIVDDIDYEAKPEINVSFCPKYGMNWIIDREDEENKNNSLSCLKSRNIGVSLIMNIPIKSTNFFYCVAGDLEHRSFHWNKGMYLIEKPLCHEDLWETMKEAIYKDVVSICLNVWDFNLTMQIGYKSNIVDHRNGFYAKAYAGVGLKFKENINIINKGETIKLTAKDILPLKDVTFLVGGTLGYWRLGLDFCYDLAYFKDSKSNGKDDEIIKSCMNPFRVSLFFDIF